MTPEAVRLVEQDTVRTGRIAMLGAPPADARRVWYVLHGYGQLAARMLAPFSGIVPADTLVVAPEGLSRFYLELPRPDGAHLQRVGATWMTREGRAGDIADAMRWLDTVHARVATERAGAPAPTYGVLAFSQGVATALRWLAHGVASGRPLAPRMVVAWAGGLADDVQQDAMQRALAPSEVVLVSGEQDVFATAGARAASLATFASWGRSATERRFDGAHVLHPPLLAELLAALPQSDALITSGSTSDTGTDTA